MIAHASPARRSTVATGASALGAVSLALGIWMVASPSSFFDRVGPFGAENGHYIRDVATWQLALGAVLLLAARRPAWRVPLLAFALLQTALHAINHLIDVGEADPSWAGPFDAIALIALAAAVGWLLRVALREEAIR